MNVYNCINVYSLGIPAQYVVQHLHAHEHIYIYVCVCVFAKKIRTQMLEWISTHALYTNIYIYTALVYRQ